MKNLTYLVGLLLLCACPSSELFAADRPARPDQCLAAVVSPEKTKREQRKVRRQQQRIDRFTSKLEKKLTRWERNGQRGGRFNLGSIGLVVLLLGALFVGLGLLIPVVGVVFIVIGALIGLVGLFLMLLLGGFTVETN